MLTCVCWVLKQAVSLRREIRKIILNNQGCGNTMPELSDLVPFHSGQVNNLNLLVLGQVQNLY